MTAIYEEVIITWGVDDDGNPVQYNVTPTYKLIQKIEQKYSISGISARIINGDPPVSHMAEIIAIMLRHAGANVSAEDVYVELVSTEDADYIFDLAHVILTAFVPQKKEQSSQQKKPAKKSKT